MNIGRAAVLITGSMIASYFILLAFWTVFHGRQTVLALFWTSQNKVDKSQLYYEKPICFLSCEQYDYILLTFFFFFFLVIMNMIEQLSLKVIEQPSLYVWSTEMENLGEIIFSIWDTMFFYIYLASVVLSGTR